jgi:hypothetical protein
MPRWLDMTEQQQIGPVLTRRVGAPLRVAVHGLPGVGSSAVVSALAAVQRFEIVRSAPEITVRVIAEVVKPEDLEAIEQAAGPVLVVLTKADLCGLGRGGPVETARRRCVRLARVAGAPVEPLVGLLARAALDPDVLDPALIEALQVLADAPADLRTAQTFVSGPHPVPATMRQRLVDTLDLFGIAHAVIALRGASDAAPDALHTVFRQVSGVDEVVARIEALGAEVRYRRLLAFISDWDLRALTDSGAAEAVVSDDVVFARMAAAIDVMSAAGLAVEVDVPAAEPDTVHLRRAVRWQQHSTGPVTALHRSCAADISRGSLRLWGAAR